MDKVGAVLVVGAGIGGSQTALDLGDAGFKVYLIESTTSIGGVMAQLDKTFPTNDCAMCIVSPKLVETGRHQNINLSINCKILDVKGEAGNFTVKVLKKSLYVNMDKCTGCGVCGKACPVEAIDIFNEGLAKYSATSVKYPQAVPLVYAINKDYCIGCGICKKSCIGEAIYLAEGRAYIKSENCIGCGQCIISCPHGYIKIKWDESAQNAQEKICEYAYGVLKSLKIPTIFLNFLIRITPQCDCFDHTDAPFCPDLGILASTDAVAIDQASVDLINQSQGIPNTAISGKYGSGVDKFRAIYPDIDWQEQLAYAEEIGLGSRKYELITYPD